MDIRWREVLDALEQQLLAEAGGHLVWLGSRAR